MNYANKNIQIKTSDKNSNIVENKKQDNFKKLELQINKHIDIFKRLKDK